MDTTLIIAGFLNVVMGQDNLFSDEAVNSLPALRENIANLGNEPDKIAQVINEWYIEYEDIRDAVVFFQDKEIKKVEKSKSEDVENTLQNQCRILQEEIEKLENRKKQKS